MTVASEIEIDDVTLKKKSKTLIAIICGILLIIPAFIPAYIIVSIYKYVLSSFIEGNPIPYLETIVLIWFPELLRGVVVSITAFKITKYLIKRFNENIVRYSIFGFWSALIAFGMIISILEHGFDLDILGGIAFIFGLGLGLHIEKTTN